MKDNIVLGLIMIILLGLIVFSLFGIGYLFYLIFTTHILTIIGFVFRLIICALLLWAIIVVIALFWS